MKEEEPIVVSCKCIVITGVTVFIQYEFMRMVLINRISCERFITVNLAQVIFGWFAIASVMWCAVRLIYEVKMKYLMLVNLIIIFASACLAVTLCFI